MASDHAHQYAGVNTMRPQRSAEQIQQRRQTGHQFQSSRPEVQSRCMPTSTAQDDGEFVEWWHELVQDQMRAYQREANEFYEELA